MKETREIATQTDDDMPMKTIRFTNFLYDMTQCYFDRPEIKGQSMLTSVLRFFTTPTYRDSSCQTDKSYHEVLEGNKDEPSALKRYI